MLVRQTRRPRQAHARRGSILLVVLAMIALFAVVALSFVLYAESEATSMRNASAARNAEAAPNPQEAANDFLGQLTFGTIDNTSAVFAHDFATTKYGWNGVGQNLSPYSGEGLPSEDVSAWVGLAPGTLNRTGVVNYTRNGAGQLIRPNVRTDGTTAINKSTPYTYPDRANFYLAMQNPLTGEIIQPSFHRPDLFDPTNNSLGSLWPGNPNWTSADGRYKIVRPRPGPPTAPEHPNFPLVPANADGTFTGDVANMKFITGSQKNDSLWIYHGAPVKMWRNRPYTAMVAPLVLDLSGRVNMSVAGNNRNPGQTHASNQGFGAWEVNPTQLGITPADLQAILNQRYGQTPTFAPNAPPDRYTNLQKGRINRGVVPPQYARLDIDAIGTSMADAMRAPIAGEYNPFLVFTPRFALDQAGTDIELTNHPQTFNPFHWPRGTQAGSHAQGMDDLVKLAARYSDPKKRFGQTEFGQLPGKSFGDPNPATPDVASQLQARALTTGFNVTQSWGEVQIATGAGAFAKLGPVDLNRPLGDYRTNPAMPYSPSNIDAVTPGSNYNLARAARQRLAMDIFLRLAALAGLVDGTNASYNPATHSLNQVVPTYANFDSLRRLAQFAANTVDIIDSDDINTAFVWNPVAPVSDPGDATNFALNASTPAELGKRVVYGTELPRLVINEAYCKLDNDRAESDDAVPPQKPPGVGSPMRFPATKNLQKKYWVELHNPLPIEPNTSPVSELGGARLQYVAGTSPGATATYAVYQVEVAETTAPQPLANHLTTAPTNVLGDPSAVGPTLVSKLRVNNYTYDPTAMPAATLMGDELNIVRPTAAATGPGGSNQGYYVLAPKDQFPSTPPAPSFKNSMSMPDPAPVAAPALPNAMWYDTGTKDPDDQANPSPKATSSVILQRLANPYLPPQAVATLPNYNPYITVDFLENIPTRDRALYGKDDKRQGGFTKSDAPSIGRKLPYAAAPSYGPAGAAILDQVPAMAGTTPGHTFFNANTGYNNAPIIHYDRELINSSELLHVSAWSPSLLTAKFIDGPLYEQHVVGSTVAGQYAAGALLNNNYPAPNLGTQLYRAFDLLTTANRLPGIPVGGREPGRVNLNTATDARVLQAVLDPQQGNSFTIPWNTSPPTDPWSGTILPTRTPNWGTAPYVRATTDETGGAGDRPFKLAASSSNAEETLFRKQPAPPAPTLYPFPMLFNPDPAPIPPYVHEEPHRKAWNNLTTVGDGFLVIWTVGFFEVDAVTAAGPTIGKELFDKVPGDLRAQYAAVVDRSTMQVPQSPAPGTNGPKPWETKLLTDAPIGSTTVTVEGTVNPLPPAAATSFQIYNDGVLVDVLPGTQIRLGTGDSSAGTPGEGEWVTIQTIAMPTAGQVTLTLSTATMRFHGGSSRVSNALPGNPGPQPGFDASSPANRHLVPYFTRLDP